MSINVSLDAEERAAAAEALLDWYGDRHSMCETLDVAGAMKRYVNPLFELMAKFEAFPQMRALRKIAPTMFETIREEIEEAVQAKIANTDED